MHKYDFSLKSQDIKLNYWIENQKIWLHLWDQISFFTQTNSLFFTFLISINHLLESSFIKEKILRNFIYLSSNNSLKTANCIF